MQVFNNGVGDMQAAFRTYQANRLACGWMSRAVSPFTICRTFTDSGILGSKKRTSPLTLQRDKTWGYYLFAPTRRADLLIPEPGYN